ncbi:swr complex subunit [Physocladia obscura]|uniref:SWR1-complex protein 4 n=1 Tax=Physocladia obscura TaxID=109957 RepID=A0AAD5XJ03_9FUNG|nr:swr complex subunit [Physocladia obscura]
MSARATQQKLVELAGGAPPLVFADVFWATQAAGRVSKPARKWTTAVITSSARSDGLALQHWIPEDEAATGREEKSKLLSTDNADSEWTREETDELFALCKRFDLRFTVVVDRLESDKSRTIEDVKERYYDVTNKILSARSISNNLSIPPQPLYIFNKQREVERKKILEALYARTPEQIKEEEYLFHELKRRELHELKWAADRDYLVKILSNHELAIPMPLPVVPLAGIQQKKKKQVEHGSGGGNGAQIETTVKRRAGPAVSVPQQIDGLIAAPHTLARREIPQGVWLRGQRPIVPKASNMHQRFKDVLEEFGLSAPPNMPNVAVCDVIDEVRLNVMVLIDVRRTCEKMEAEIAQLKERKKALLAGEISTGVHSGGPAILRGDSDEEEFDEIETTNKRRKKAAGGGNLMKKARLH